MYSADRYAVYYAPPEASALARFGAAWLGWDPAAGTSVAHPDAPPLSGAEITRVTEFPRRFGFHGTLKAPFRLADGRGYDDLKSALAALAATLRPIAMPGLALSRLGRFVALTPTGNEAALAELATRLVVDLDALRAPLDDGELDRRRHAGLTPRQDELLRLWGYPYVLEEFRFHLTLTGALAPADGERAMTALRPLVAAFEEEPFEIEEVCLFADPGGGGPFRLLDRLALGG